MLSLIGQHLDFQEKPLSVLLQPGSLQKPAHKGRPTAQTSEQDESCPKVPGVNRFSGKNIRGTAKVTEHEHEA